MQIAVRPPRVYAYGSRGETPFINTPRPQVEEKFPTVPARYIIIPPFLPSRPPPPRAIMHNAATATPLALNTCRSINRLRSNVRDSKSEIRRYQAQPCCSERRGGGRPSWKQDANLQRGESSKSQAHCCAESSVIVSRFHSNGWQS